MKKEFTKGNKVRLVIGPFKGRTGQVVRVEKSKSDWATWVIVGFSDGKTQQYFANELELI